MAETANEFSIWLNDARAFVAKYCGGSLEAAGELVLFGLSNRTLHWRRRAIEREWVPAQELGSTQVDRRADLDPDEPEFWNTFIPGLVIDWPTQTAKRTGPVVILRWFPTPVQRVSTIKLVRLNQGELETLVQHLGLPSPPPPQSSSVTTPPSDPKPLIVSVPEAVRVVVSREPHKPSETAGGPKEQLNPAPLEQTATPLKGQEWLENAVKENPQRYMEEPTVYAHRILRLMELAQKTGLVTKVWEFSTVERRLLDIRKEAAKSRKISNQS
jgi:hypothetical protein